MWRPAPPARGPTLKVHLPGIEAAPAQRPTPMTELELEQVTGKQSSHGTDDADGFWPDVPFDRQPSCWSERACDCDISARAWQGGSPRGDVLASVTFMFR